MKSYLCDTRVKGFVLFSNDTCKVLGRMLSADEYIIYQYAGWVLDKSGGVLKAPWKHENDVPRGDSLVTRILSAFDN